MEGAALDKNVGLQLPRTSLLHVPLCPRHPVREASPSWVWFSVVRGYRPGNENSRPMTGTFTHTSSPKLLRSFVRDQEIFFLLRENSLLHRICTAPTFSATFIIRIRYKCNFTPRTVQNERPVARPHSQESHTVPHSLTARRGHQRCSRPRLFGVEARKFDHEGAR